MDLPEVNELVICKVVNITPYAAWCELKEYNATGMIHLNEVAPRIVKNIKHYVKENKEYVAKVIRVDKNKRFVYLSLKRVSKIEERKKWEDYRKKIRGEMILKQIEKETGYSKEELKNKILKVYENLFDALVEIRKNPKIMEELDIPAEYRGKILEVLKKNIKEKVIEIKVEITARSLASDGVQKVKEVLKQIEKSLKGDVTLIASPKYLLTIETTNPKQKEKEVINYLEKMKKKNDLDEFDFKLIK